MDKLYLRVINQKVMVTNLKDLMKKFSDESQCRAFLVQQRWNGNPTCPYCGSEKWYNIENGKRFKCGNNKCYKKYSVTVGTVFEASNIPLTTWFPAMYLISAHKKGISSVQLAKDLGVTQKTAWFMLHRIRESLKDKNSELLTGTVEIDETYMARKYGSEYKIEKKQHLSKKMNEQIIADNSKKRNKGAVIGIIQRDGKAIIKALETGISAQNIKEMVNAHVHPSATLNTDESNLYTKSLADYYRCIVSHRRGEFVRGDVHVNTVENFWSVMKRGIYGIYHQISAKHLQAYCNEFSYRYNSRKIKDGERFEICLTQLEGRLKYLTLIQKNKDGQSGKESSQKES